MAILQPLEKNHTYMSVDIAKSTQLIGELEAEAAREILEKGLKIIVNTVYQHGGSIVYTAGDGAVAKFISLSTYVNHLMLAVAAGVAIQKKLEEAKLPYKVRIGIDTICVGKLNKKEDSYEIAALVQEHTPPGSVCMSEYSSRYIDKSLSDKISLIKIRNQEYLIYKIKIIPEVLKKEIRKKISDLVFCSEKKQDNVGEIKFISIIFMSIDESSHQLSESEASNCIHRVKEILKDYNATLIKSRGLSFMAAIGAPIAYEDHAIRACLVAHRILKIAEDLQLPNQIKLGINSGPTVVDDIGSKHFHQYDAMGPAVNFAARLEQLAQPGQILVSQDTEELVKDAINLKLLYQQTVRGFKGKHNIYALENIERVYISQKLEWEFYSNQIFIDHVAEMRMFEDKLAALGSQAVVWGIKAEPGIGKSRLNYEFSKVASKLDVKIFMLGALSYQKNQPFSLVRQFFMRAMSIDPANDVDTKKQIIINFINKIENQDPFEKSAFFSVFGFETDAAWQSLPVKESLNIIASCFYKVLKEVIADRKTILAFDDMQWCDEQSLSIFFHIFTHLTQEPVFVLMSYRPEFHSKFAMFQKQETELQPLSLHDSNDFMNYLFGDNDSVSAIKEKIIKQSEGNPFYMEEITRYLINNGILVKRGKTYKLKSPDISYQIPETIYGVISGSIDQLSLKNKQLLQQASILGPIFSLSDLQLLTELDQQALAQHLKELEEARLIFTKELFPETQYAFKHAYIVDIAYQMMLTKNRVKYHKKFVQALEELTEVNQKIPALAYHSYQANLWKKSFIYYTQLIPHHVSIEYPINKILEDSIKALTAYEHMNDKDKVIYFEEYAIIKMKRLHGLMASGNLEDSIEPIKNLIDQSQALKNDWIQSLAIAHLMMLYFLLNASFELSDLNDKIIQLGENALKQKNDIDANNYMATLYCSRMLFDSVHANYKSLHTDCQFIFDNIKEPNAVSTWLALPIWSVCRVINVVALREQMKLTRENAHLDEIEQALQNPVPTESTANNYRALGVAHLFFGDLDKAEKYFNQALEDSLVYDYLVHIPSLNAYLALVYMLGDYHDKAVIYAKKAYELSKRMHHMYFGLISMGRIANVLLNYKNFSLVEQILNESLPLAEKAKNKILCIELYQIKAELLIASQEKPDVRLITALLKQSSSLIEEVKAVYFYPYVQLTYVRLSIKLGQVKEAQSYWQSIVDFFDEYPSDFLKAYFVKAFKKL